MVWVGSSSGDGSFGIKYFTTRLGYRGDFHPENEQDAVSVVRSELASHVLRVKAERDMEAGKRIGLLIISSAAPYASA